MSRTLMAAEKEGPSLTEERRKALNLAITQIEKTCGKGGIMRMGADSPRVRVEAIPTGAINLDAAIGIGGIPRGRVTEIFGPESSGKTTLALHVVGNAQRAGGAAAYIDAEHALDVEYAKKLGVDRSEEHTSELQSLTNLVCRLLLEKKKNKFIKGMYGE